MNERIVAKLVSPDLRQFYRFAIVGCLNVMVSLVIFVLCYEVWPLASLILSASGDFGKFIQASMAGHGIHSIDGAFANFMGYAAGMANSFVLNKAWTFRVQGDTLQQIHRFFLLNILGLLLSTMILFVFVDLLGGPHLFVWSISTALVMILNFYGNKFWTFAEGPKRMRP